NTVPLSSVVPTFRADSSASLSLLTGNPSLVQITTACAPGRAETTFLATSSIFTVARPFLSWPVMTRRIRKLMDDPPWIDRGLRVGMDCKANQPLGARELRYGVRVDLQRRFEIIIEHGKLIRRESALRQVMEPARERGAHAGKGR